MSDRIDPYDRSDPRPEAYHRRMEIQQRELESEREYARLEGRLTPQSSAPIELSWRGALVGAILVGLWANMQHAAPGGAMLVGAGLGLFWRVWFKAVAFAGICLLIFVFSQAPRERKPPEAAGAGMIEPSPPSPAEEVPDRPAMFETSTPAPEVKPDEPQPEQKPPELNPEEPKPAQMKPDEPKATVPTIEQPKPEEPKSG